ncbi:MAG TPA: glucose-1-phosphate thymidylyltransferase [Streptosporangiaceae bacterium]|nr:glucose-1-phosphate thymidylyltransferase [Streptosporangiaceae bacterium]
MKALVLSGGSGVRLRPFSYSMPKQLIPIANRPVLEHVLGNIRALGVTEIALVVGDWAAEIAEAVGDGSRFGAHITYIRQDRPLGLAHAVLLARPFLAEDDFVMYLGDNILQDGVVEIAEEFRASRPAAHIVVHEVPDPRAYGVAEVDADGVVQRLVEKPAQPGSRLAIVGVYFFTAAIHEAVTAIACSARGELEITDAIQWLVSHGAEVRAREYSGFWKDAGRVEDVLECNRRLLGELRPAIAGQVDASSELRGAVVEPGARVVRSRIEGPAIIGANTLIEDSHIGPNTSIGRDCVLRGTDLADSVVLDGTSISAVSGLHGCLIGRSASIGPRGDGEIRHRIVVGDHARIEIAT